MTPNLEKHIKDQVLERDAEIARLRAENVDKAKAWDAIAEKNATIARLRAENERLVLGIQNFLDGDYEPRLKGAEKCKHGEFPWNACEACIEEHFQRVLNPQQSGDSNG